MKKRTSIAVITAFMMIFTMVPATVFAGSTGQKVESKTGRTFKELDIKKIKPAGAYGDYMEEIRQLVLEELEYTYNESVKPAKYYCAEVWKEINDTYINGREAINNAATLSEIDEAYYYYVNGLELLGELDKSYVKSIKDLPKLKKEFIGDIGAEFKMLRKSDYNTYYWDMILDNMYMGKAKISKATTFSDLLWGYIEALYAIDEALTKWDLAEEKTWLTDALKRYVYIGLDPLDYSETTTPKWSQIKAIYNKAVADIKGKDNEEGMYGAFEDAMWDFEALTGAPVFVWYDYPFIENLCDRLVEAYYAYDEMKYSENGSDRLMDICEEAYYKLEEATTRTSAQAIYNKAIKDMAAVPTLAKEIKAFKAAVPKVKVTGTTKTTAKLKWGKVKNADYYLVYKATKKGGPYKKIGKARSTKFTSKKLTSGKTYYYKVRAVATDLDWRNEVTYYSKYSKAVRARTK